MPKIKDSWKEEERRKTPLVVLPVSYLPLTNSLQIRRERKRDPSREEEMVLQGYVHSKQDKRPHPGEEECKLYYTATCGIPRKLNLYI